MQIKSSTLKFITSKLLYICSKGHNFLFFIYLKSCLKTDEKGELDNYL